MIIHRSGNILAVAAPPIEPPPKEEEKEPPPKEEEKPVLGTRAFNAGSPFNTLIPANPVLDPNSAAMISQFGGSSAVANLHEFGTPVWESKAGDPFYFVNPREHWAGFFEGNIRIPASAHTSTGSDGSMIVIDLSSVSPGGGPWAYDFFSANKVEGKWVCTYDSRFEFQGNGCPGHGASGADMPLLATLTRAFEIEQGHIDHAMSIATTFTAGPEHSESSVRFPAFKSDGHGSYPPAFPEGARLQLDPAINVAAIAGIKPVERIIAEAAQKYGFYIKNTSGASLSMGFEDTGDPTLGTNFYNKHGLTHDYFNLSNIPWKNMRVLKKWDGK